MTQQLFITRKYIALVKLNFVTSLIGYVANKSRAVLIRRKWPKVKDHATHALRLSNVEFQVDKLTFTFEMPLNKN